MQVNGSEDCNRLGASRFLGASSTIVNGGYGAIDNRGSEDSLAIISDVEHPPLGVKLTGYRLLNMGVVFVFGLTKAILTYMGQSAVPTTLDWVSGALLAVCLYWVGLYEAICSKKWEWFFHVDLTPTICYSFMRFVGGVLGVLFSLQGTLAITSLCSIPVFLFAHFIPRIALDIWLVVYICFTLGAHYSWMKTWRLRGWGWFRQYAAHLLQTYGLAAPLSEKHEWSGTVGTTMGFFCGIALVCSPLGMVYLSLAGTRELHDTLGEVYG